jgi:hypothetical protein
MLMDIVEVQTRGGTTLFVEFEDGTAGEVDVCEHVDLTGVFKALSDPAVFAQVRVHSELGTIFWPSGADLDPDVLYAALTGEQIEIEAPATITS